MSKHVMTATFAIGLAAVGWVGWGFIGSSPLALAMTVVIAAVYGVGAVELLQFRRATASLSSALADLAATQGLLTLLTASHAVAISQAAVLVDLLNG